MKSFFLLDKVPVIYKEGGPIPLFNITYLKLDRHPILCDKELIEVKPTSSEAALGDLYLCDKCGGSAEIQIVFSVRGLEAFNTYKRFYSGLKIEEDCLKAKISGPCSEICDLLAEIIYDYKYYGP